MAAETALRHLQVLRALLSRDYLSRADWGWALRDVAEMARQGLSGSEGFVAVHDARSGRWKAVTAKGETLGDEQISAHGSRSVLEVVRRTDKPLLTSLASPLNVSSESVDALDIGYVLAVPIHFWDVTEQVPRRRLGGCLYVHRTAGGAPFTQEDAALMLDVARIAEPVLNVLSRLQSVESDLAQSKERLVAMTRLAARLGAFETQDAAFARDTLATLQRAASAAKVGILVLGPTGSGKTYLARTYHDNCPRKAGPFVTLDGSQATSAETLAAELFGYAPASGYQNAPPKGRPGKAQLADGGTLFVDEVAALTPELQQRLLRLLQSGTFSPLGSGEEHSVDVQVIAATNADLPELVREGRFREDLYWRLGEVIVRLPPLSERPADIAGLARSFLEKARLRYGRSDVARFAEGAMEALLAHDWARAGNVRGLEHTVARAVLLAPPGTAAVDREHLKLEELPSGERPAPAAARAAEPSPGRAAPPRTEPRSRRQLSDAGREELRVLLERKIEEKDGVLTALANDAEIARCLGYERAVPPSTLALWLRDLDLLPALEEGRRRQRTELEALKAALRVHRSAAGAAQALGMTRDALLWQLRKAGLTVADVLAEG